MLQQGTLFDNRYELIRLIGRGGFAEVWLVKDTLTDLEEAMKIYAPGGGMDEDGLKIFAKELAVVHDLRHTNLLTPKTMSQYDNQPYLIMQYCPNGSLNKMVGHCTEGEAWKILEQVAAGLAYLHKRKIVHQDIKPDNILIDANMDCVITDFGISLKAQSTLRKSMRVQANSGTMAYMAPERFSEEPHPIPANDIWSLGAMMFELLEGNVPFVAQMGGLAQMNGAKIPTMHADVNTNLKQVVLSMLDVDVEKRPTAEQLTELAKQKIASNKNVVAASKPNLQEVSTLNEHVTATVGDMKTKVIDRSQLQNVKMETPKQEYSKSEKIASQKSEQATSKFGKNITKISLGLVGVGSIATLCYLYYRLDWYYSSYVSATNIFEVLIWLSGLLSAGLGIAFVWLAWKRKETFIQNSPTIKKWLTWGLSSSVIGCLCMMQPWYYDYADSLYNYLLYDLIFPVLLSFGVGLVLSIIGYACLLWRMSKQPKVDAETKPISLKPWLILMAILGIAVILIAVKSLIQNEENSQEPAAEPVEAETSASIVQPTYIDLGLPSGTMWKNVNEEGGYYSYDVALAQFGESLPTPEHFTELIEKCTWRWEGNGYTVEGPNGNSIFLPADGWDEPGKALINKGRAGEYCSSEADEYVHTLCFFKPDDNNNRIVMGTSWTDAIYLRWSGKEDRHTVRLVQNPQ